MRLPSWVWLAERVTSTSSRASDAGTVRLDVSVARSSIGFGTSVESYMLVVPAGNADTRGEHPCPRALGGRRGDRESMFVPRHPVPTV
jgi:hypothetical protein